jgi:exopolysaccharide production protein ExoY
MRKLTIPSRAQHVNWIANRRKTGDFNRLTLVLCGILELNMNSENTSLTARSQTFSPGLLEISIRPPETKDGPVGGKCKRSMDIVLAISTLIVLLPIIGMVVLLLKMTTRDRVIFSHQRIGYRGKPFKCFKFRTMVSNGDQVLADYFVKFPVARVEWEARRKLRDDPRVTPVGRILRSTSLDELPQIFNVLMGSMSIVGPRPIVNAEIERYGMAYGAYQSCRPGITGLWQVSGRSNCGYEQRIAFDDSYARDWSILRDCWIIWKTVGVVISREGSC